MNDTTVDYSDLPKDRLLQEYWLHLAPVKMTTGEHGFLDHFNAAFASGWVMACGSGDPIVIALAGDRIIAEAAANENRPDSSASARDYSYRGFTLRIPEPLP